VAFKSGHQQQFLSCVLIVRLFLLISTLLILNMTINLPYNTTIINGDGIKLETFVCNERVIIGYEKRTMFLRIYINLTRKLFINLALLHLPLIFASFFIPYKTTASAILHVKTPLSNVTLLNLGNILVVNFVMFTAESYHFPRKETQLGMQKVNF
jgi:hypothetical protein